MSFGGKAKRLGRFLIALVVSVVFGLMNFSTAHAAMVPVVDAASFKAALNAGNDMQLMGDVSMNEKVVINLSVGLDLNGHTLTFENIPPIPDKLQSAIITYADLNVYDSSAGKNGKIVGYTDFTIAIGTTAEPMGSLVLDAGTIDCKGAYCIDNNGELEINGGKISGQDYAVYSRDRSEIIMRGGEVVASVDPAVRLGQNAAMTMDGGLIEIGGDGNAVTVGGPGAQFEMNGGEIRAMQENAAGVVAFKDGEVVINDGTISANSFALAGNGSDSGNNNGVNAKFTINGGTLSSEISPAIYAPQVNGITTINGGTISGLSAIEIRAGTLVVNGGTLNGFGDYEVVGEKSGSTTKGAAVAVSQHNTKRPISVTISGGQFNADVPVSNANPLNNPEEDFDKVVLDIEGGEFNATGEKDPVIDEAGKKFIRGGIFTSTVAQYVADGYGEALLDDNRIGIFTVYAITVDAEEGIITIDPSAPYKKKVTFVTTNKEGFRVVVEVTDANGNAVTVDGDMFEMPESDVVVRVHYEEIPPEEDGPAVPDTGSFMAWIGAGLKNFGILAVALLGLFILFGKGIYHRAEKRGRKNKD